MGGAAGARAYSRPMARFRFPPNGGGLRRRKVLDEPARPQSVRDSGGADTVLALKGRAGVRGGFFCQGHQTESGTSPLRRRRRRRTQATIIVARGDAGRVDGYRLGKASPNSTLRSSVQQRQPCQLHDCSSSRQLVTVLPPPPPIHRHQEIPVAPQDYLCARPRRFRPPRLASLLRHCPSHFEV